jgi:plastocyanin
MTVTRIQVAAVLLLAVTTPARAGRIEGVVIVPEVTVASARPNAYPGRAGSMPTMPAEHSMPTDAVVYLDQAPPSTDSSMKIVQDKTPKLSQQGQAFRPRVLAVATGTTVEFPNMDPIYHNVFSLSPPKRFDLGKYPRGHSRSVTFTKPGLVNVYCDIHSDMAGYILVIPHHAFVRPSAQGGFSMSPLPAGRYVVRAWHPDFGTLERTVDVPATGVANVEFRF